MEEINTNIITNMKEVYDPEISINVYDLGLIYDINVTELPKVTVTHTLTSAFCPFADQMVADITKAGYVANVLNVEVVTTFDPPFSMDMVPEETRMMLGWI